MATRLWALTQITEEVDVRAEVTSSPDPSGYTAMPLGCVTSPPGQARLARGTSFAFVVAFVHRTA